MALPSRLTFYKANDQIIKLTGLKNTNTDAYMNSATVTATLYDSAGSAVSGLTSVSFSYVSSSNGDYKGSVAETFDPTVGIDYTLKIDATQGAIVGHWEIPSTVAVRTT